MSILSRIAERAGRGKSDWMCTFTGRQYYPAAPRAADVDIRDIAHHLSMICRYTGAVRKFYSVAEHSILVSEVVPPELALLGLMHDATEAYVNDLSRPLKRSLPDYRRIEELNWRAIAARFDLPVTIPEAIHQADVAVLHAERVALMPWMTREQEADWPAGRAADVHVNCLEPAAAEELFLHRFHQLTKAQGGPVRKLDFFGRYVSVEGCAAWATIRRAR